MRQIQGFFDSDTIMALKKKKNYVIKGIYLIECVKSWWYL